MAGEDETTLLVIGLGYTGRAIAQAAIASGWTVFGTVRAAVDVPSGVVPVPFDDADAAIAAATHLVSTAAPLEHGGDPALLRHGAALRRAGRLRAIAYLSSTGVYGDRDGAAVDENTEPAPSSPRGHRRLEAERGWAALARSGEGGDGGRAVDLIRLAGIYGPGRSALDELRAGRARPIRAPGHAFGRIHRDDIAAGTLAALRTADPARVPLRVLNFSDDEPAESADVIGEAAALLGIAPPPERTLAEAWEGMSPMARSFWADNRRVRSARTVAALGRAWRHPTYREGLRAILAAEREQLVEQRAEQGEVRRP